MLSEDRENLVKEVIGAAIEVHRFLGPGLLENSYEICLCKELELRGLNYTRQQKLSIHYKGLLVEEAYRLDIVVEDELILELKSVTEVNSICKYQLLTYLKLSNKKLGLLINFNVKLLKDGLMRVIN